MFKAVIGVVLFIQVYLSLFLPCVLACRKENLCRCMSCFLSSV